MTNKNVAFITYNRLMTNSDTFIYKAPGKLAALWYDKVILQVDDFTHNNVKHEFSMYEEWEQDTVEEIDDFYIPIDNYIKDPQKQLNFRVDNEKLLKIGDEVGLTYCKDKYGDNFQEDNARHMAHSIKVSRGLCNGISVWEDLNNLLPSALLPDHYESLVLNTYLKSLKVSREPINTVKVAIPNLENYSWEEIVDLRHHEFFNQFRSKMNQLTISFQDRDLKLSEELIKEILFKDLTEIAKQFKPRPKRKALGSFLSNFPLGEINPFSVISSLGSLKRDIKISKEYGWVYFMLDMME